MRLHLPSAAALPNQVHVNGNKCLSDVGRKIGNTWNIFEKSETQQFVAVRTDTDNRVATPLPFAYSFGLQNSRRHINILKVKTKSGGSPGLVVMGRDQHSEGRGVESRHHILDGHFFTYICCKNWIACLKRPKINEKEAGVGPLKKTKLTGSLP